MKSKVLKIFKIAIINLRMMSDKLRGGCVVILDLEEAMLLPFLLPVVEELRRKSKRLVFYATYKTTCPVMGDMELPRERTFFYQWSKYMFAADIFIAPQVWGRVPKRVLKVHVPHGHPVKWACLPKEYFEHFDIHFLIGPLHREQTEFTISHYDIKRTIRLYDVGMPKSDRLMNGLYDRASLLRNLGLDPAKKTLIYAPSWEEGLSVRSFGHKIFQQFASLHEINVLIKLHPASCSSKSHPEYDFYTGGTDWPSVAKSYEQGSNIRNIVTNDIGPLLDAGDIMVTDISGVALEFLSLLKPVIYIDCPEFFSKTLTGLYKNFGPNTVDYIKNDPKSNAGRHVGYVVEKIEELPAAVRFMFANPDFKLNERQAYAKRILYNPGHASEIAADIVLELLAR